MQLTRRVLVAVACLTLAASLTACGSGDEDAGPRDPIATESSAPTESSPSPSESGSTPTANVTTPTQTGDPVKDAVLEGYVGFTNASTNAYVTKNPQLPELLLFATGGALEGVQRYVGTLTENGERYAGSLAIAPEIVGADASSGFAAVTDCVDQTGIEVFDTAGTSLPLTGGDRFKVESTLRLNGTVWQVDTWIVPEGTC